MEKTIGHLEFKTQKAALEYFKAILNSYSVSRPRLSKEDTRDVTALLHNHPESERKIGSGIKCFTVEQNDYGSLGFILHRTDGSHTDFSYIHSVRGKPRTLDQEIKRSGRAAILEDILQFRDSYFAENSVCQATGISITSEESNIDHYPVPFREIIKQFREKFQCGWEDISAPADNQYYPEFSPEMVEKFRKFHRNFGLRIVHKDVIH